MKASDSAGGWLPIDIEAGLAATLATECVVRWMEFGPAPLAEPFLDHTVDRLRQGTPPAREWVTGLDAILRAASGLPEVKPAGFIFHISRCGSTLLCNVLKTIERAQIVSESRALAKLLLPDPLGTSAWMRELWSQRRGTLLRSLFSLFAHHPCGQAQPLVLKMVSLNTLCLREVRSYWPDVPCVVVVRDPAEVMVATLQSPDGGWMALHKSPEIADAIFAFEDKPVAEMSKEEYCARVLGKFMRSALAAPNDGCIVVDHEDLNERRMREIASFLGLSLPESLKKLEPALSYYAKDPKVRQKYEDDRKQKQNLITPEIRSASARWAMPAYNNLRAR